MMRKTLQIAIAALLGGCLGDDQPAPPPAPTQKEPPARADADVPRIPPPAPDAAAPAATPDAALAADGPAAAPAYKRPQYDALPNNGEKASGIYVYAGGVLPSGVDHDDLYVFQLDEQTGNLAPRGRIPNLGKNPIYASSFAGKYIYVAVDGTNNLAALKVEAHGGLGLINLSSSLGKIADLPPYPKDRATRVNSTGATVQSAGSAPVYVRVHRSGKYVISGNYQGDISVFPVREDGGLGASTVYYTGRKTHSVNIHPTKNVVYAFNTEHTGVFPNSVVLFQMDEATGALAPHPKKASLELPPFTLARHSALHPGGGFLYTIGEASDVVTVFKLDADGLPTVVKDYPTLPVVGSDPLNRSTGGEIMLSGDYLYASNRGSERDGTKTTIVVFQVDTKDPSKLTVVEHAQTRGDHARGFAIDPSGRFMVVANQWTSDLMNDRSLAGNFSTYAIGPDGRLKFLASTQPGDTNPIAVVMLKL